MVQKSNVEVRYAQIPDDLERIIKLWFDYLVWDNVAVIIGLFLSIFFNPYPNKT